MNNRQNAGERSQDRSGASGHRPDALKAYLDGELSGPHRWLTRAHLARCPACREESEALKRVSKEIQQLPQPEPRPELRARILASLPETPPARMALPALNSRRPRLALGVAAFASLLIGAFALSRFSTHAPENAAPPRGMGAAGTHLANTPPVPSPASGGAETYGAPVAGSQETAPPAPAVTVSRDPFSEMADNMTKRQLEEEARRNARNSAADAVRRPGQPFGRGTATDPLRLAISAPDTEEMGAQLQDVLKRLGGVGSVVSVTHTKPIHFQAASGPAGSYLAAPSTEAHPARMLLACLPTSQVTAFQHELRRLADTPAPTAGITPQATTPPVAPGPRDGNLVPGKPVPSKSDLWPNHTGRPVRPTATFEASDPAERHLPRLMSRPNANSQETRITFLIWLKPAPSSHSH